MTMQENMVSVMMMPGAGNTVRVLGGIGGGDGRGNQGAKVVVTKTQGDETINEEESRVDRGEANTGSFKSSVAGATRTCPKAAITFS
jgi:hypothetical protein